MGVDVRKIRTAVCCQWLLYTLSVWCEVYHTYLAHTIQKLSLFVLGGSINTVPHTERARKEMELCK